MAKKLIGIDIGHDRTMRVALAVEEKGKSRLVAVAEHVLHEGERATDLLPGMIGELAGFGNRTVAALPPGSGFVRNLTLPFADSKKIAAILPFELSAQLPVTADDCIIDFLPPTPAAEGGFNVQAAAVPAARVAEAIDRLQGDVLPLHILDLAPFAYAGGLGGRCDQGLLVCLDARQVSLLLVVDGRSVDQRQLPTAEPAALAPRLLRESAALQHGSGKSDLPLHLIGVGAEALHQELEKRGVEVSIPVIELDGRPLAPEFLPAAALALRAAAERERGFNLRRGPFALRNEWTVLRKRMIAAALLLFLTLGAGLAGAWVKYAEKASQAEQLEMTMTSLYRQTFPRAKVIIDIPRQMRSGINELNQRVALMGASGGQSALSTLNEVSARIPAEITVDVRELNYSVESLRLEGVTDSFEAVNRMAKSLEQSPLFARVQITDAKMSIDGGRIDFRFTIPLGSREESP